MPSRKKETASESQVGKDTGPRFFDGVLGVKIFHLLNLIDLLLERFEIIL